MLHRSGGQWIRFPLLAVLLVFSLSGAALSSANPVRVELPQIPHSSLTMAEVGAEIAGAVAGVPEPAAGAASVAVSSHSVAEQTAANSGREDLTVFFSIGVAVDVLLVAAFLMWAVGQWRRTKK